MERGDKDPFDRHLTSIDELLNKDELKALARYSQLTALILTILAIMTFWTGLLYLDESFFYHRFNQTRHIIVEQDLDTYEIYAWKDAFGHIYTPSDPHTKYFPHAVTVFILLLLGIFSALYRFLINHKKMKLLITRLTGSPDFFQKSENQAAS